MRKSWTQSQSDEFRLRFLRPNLIFEADHQSQKAVSANPITDTDLFKSIFYHVELFILILQSVFLDIYSGPEFRFRKWGEFPSYVTLVRESHLNVWSCCAFLFLELCNCCRKAYTLHTPDFTQGSTTDTSVYHKHNCIHCFDFKSKHGYWKGFSLWLFFSFTVIQSL